MGWVIREAGFDTLAEPFYALLLAGLHAMGNL